MISDMLPPKNQKPASGAGKTTLFKMIAGEAVSSPLVPIDLIVRGEGEEILVNVAETKGRRFFKTALTLEIEGKDLEAEAPAPRAQAAPPAPLPAPKPTVRAARRRAPRPTQTRDRPVTQAASVAEFQGWAREAKARLDRLISEAAA